MTVRHFSRLNFATAQAIFVPMFIRLECSFSHSSPRMSGLCRGSSFRPQFGLPPGFRRAVDRAMSLRAGRPTIAELLDVFESEALCPPGTDFEVFHEYRRDLIASRVERVRMEIGGIIDDRAPVEMSRAESEQGNRSAMLLSGIQRREGRGCTVNKRLAVQLFKSAADRGIPEAQLQYGILTGGNAETRAESAMMIHAAADAGNAEAQLRFALLAAAVPDHAAVHRYMRLAIAQESADMLMKGSLLPRDAALAER
jgi:hypothetical protein